jgi:hypothetical protein
MVGRLAGAQAAHDLDAAPGTHAARHRDRRQHDALVGMAVGAELALHDGLAEEHGEPVRRQLVTALDAVRIDVEGRGDPPDGHHPEIVLHLAHAPDPGAQLHHRFVHPAHTLVPSNLRFASSNKRRMGKSGPFHDPKV